MELSRVSRCIEVRNVNGTAPFITPRTLFQLRKTNSMFWILPCNGDIEWRLLHPTNGTRRGSHTTSTTRCEFLWKLPVAAASVNRIRAPSNHRASPLTTTQWGRTVWRWRYLNMNYVKRGNTNLFYVWNLVIKNSSVVIALIAPIQWRSIYDFEMVNIWDRNRKLRNVP